MKNYGIMRSIVIIIFMIMCAGTCRAQTFDFGCEPPDYSVSLTEITYTVGTPADFLTFQASLGDDVAFAIATQGSRIIEVGENALNGLNYFDSDKLSSGTHSITIYGFDTKVDLLSSVLPSAVSSNTHEFTIP